MKKAILPAMPAAFCILMLSLTGCAPAIVGTAAVGTYKGATDPRSVGTMLDDSVIASRVKTDLISSRLVTARHVDVDVVDGVVYLTGVVESEQEQRMAESLAANVSGVKAVKNQLVVGELTLGQALDDAIMVSRINTNLIMDREITSMSIDVDVNLGMVTLTGLVASESMHRKVLQITRETSGRTDIVDNLRVAE